MESSRGLNYVLCKKCKSEYYPASFGDGKKAVAAWNKRSIEDKIYKKTEKLEAENKMLIGALKAIKKIVDKPPLSIYAAARIYAQCCDALNGENE